MAKTVLTPRAALNTSSSSGIILATVNLPDNATAISLELERCVAGSTSNWSDPATHVDVKLEVSLDGGTTWISAGGFSSNGGPPALNWRGEPAAISGAKFWLPAGTNRRLRGTITKSGGAALTTFGTAYYDTVGRAARQSTHHSIAYDNADSVQGTGVATITIPAYVAGGTNRFLFVGAGNSAGAPHTTTSVIRGGTENFIEIWDVQDFFFACSGSYFVNPSTSAADIVVTLSAGGDEVFAGAVSLTGVHQTVPIGTAGTTTGPNSASTMSVTVTAGDTDWLIDCGYQFTTTITAGADQDLRCSEANIGGATAGAITTQLGTANDVMSYTDTANQWSIGAVPVKVAAGNGGTYTGGGGVLIGGAVTVTPQDRKITELTALASPVVADLVCIVDSTTSPASKKLTIDNLLTLFVSDVTMTVLTATSGATYTPPAGAKKLLIGAVGGGGGGNGGAATDSAGGGGGGGGTCLKLVSSTAVTNGVYTVGPGGAVSNAGTASSGINTTFNIDSTNIITAGGGGGGTQGAIFSVVGVGVAGGAGGTATGGDLNMPGKRGERGVIYSGTNGWAGSGGDSVFGFGAGQAGVNTTGSPGGAYGGGGCGGHASAVTNKEGSAGAKGTIFILEFFG